MSDTMVRLNLSHSTLEEIALEASALTTALGLVLDKATANKLQAKRVVLPNVGRSGLLLFENPDDISFLLW